MSAYPYLERDDINAALMLRMMDSEKGFYGPVNLGNPGELGDQMAVGANLGNPRASSLMP